MRIEQRLNQLIRTAVTRDILPKPAKNALSALGQTRRHVPLPIPNSEVKPPWAESVPRLETTQERSGAEGLLAFFFLSFRSFCPCPLRLRLGLGLGLGLSTSCAKHLLLPVPVVSDILLAGYG